MNKFIQHINETYGNLGSLGFIVGLALLGSLVYHLIFSILRSRFLTTYTKAPSLLQKYVYYPGLFFFLLICLSLGFPILRKNLDAEGISFIKHAYNILLILNITILLLRLIIVVREVVLSYYELDGDDDNLSSRKIVTQLRVIERIISFIVIITSIALILMTFKTIREVGISILASAGVIGIVIGFAAQKSIANIVAGIQLAFAQPIRLDDIVIVENEWGRIEEITLTYVVVKLWDERRLIVPLNYFIEKPFQNWTRHSSDLIGSVIFYTDYTVPLDALREEFRRLLANHPLWDKRNSNLQVTDANKNSLEIRVLMSAENAGEVFNLRCDIREGLITFLQKNYPNSLPKSRVEITNNPPLIQMPIP